MKTELRVLFYSPIAWLILIVFALQSGIEFCGNFAEQFRSLALGYTPYAPTSSIFAGHAGVISKMLDNLYLYIPLLTMGLMSRELSSGSIKLLYSSPVSNIQIIAGKYLSTMVYGLGFILILALQIGLGWVFIKDFDITMVLVALLGLYLTVCAYAAIGLFMSTITQYQVVAAIGTLAVLAVLNFIGSVGQEIDFVRDITYWLSISGRSETFMEGMINSADLLYFLLVVLLFLTLSVIKLHGERSKPSPAVGALKYGAVIVAVLGLGYVSSLPTLTHYYDGTQTKRNTLTPASQEVVAKLDGGLTLTTYVNILEQNYDNGMPAWRNWDMDRFEKYVRFKPEMKIRYVYYYHRAYFPYLDQKYPDLTDEERLEKLCENNDWDKKMFLPYSEIAKTVDLSGENYRFVRLFERENGQRIFLRLYEDQQRHPGETEISTALKTLVTETPLVGFVTGHDERSIDNMGVRGYGLFARETTFRYSLLNEGFRVTNLSLTEPVSPDISVMVISDMREPFTPTEMQHYRDYIARGGNLVVLGEPRRQADMNPVVEPLGLRFTDDLLVRPTKEFLADLMTGNITPQMSEISREFNTIRRYDEKLATVTACGVEQIADAGFEVVDCIVTDSTGVWNERQTRNFVDETPTLDARSGEVEKPYSLMKYLAREVRGREQRIFVLGDADCFSGSELSTSRNGIRAANFSLIQAMFKMMSYGEFPVDTSRVRPPDNEIYLTQAANPWLKLAYEWCIPGLLLLGSILIWTRRRNR